MNKYQEALLNIRYYYAQSQKYKKLQKYNAIRQLETLQELVDRATPKEPIIESQDYGYSYCYCPTCDANVGIETHLYTHNKYCHYCGQALDWSEE
ncbi:hypothetical protein [Solobacterium moorei]|uniref:hypothetical protein n=1 Tax=Solobacterium moorei TaxID=102148 RepID=UPI000422E1BE|nr:hypothetical protein [Solobacterium moorei]BET21229.1 hypothetical protein RGT18_08170 [Solobacterium moorei]